MSGCTAQDSAKDRAAVVAVKTPAVPKPAQAKPIFPARTNRKVPKRFIINYNKRLAARYQVVEVEDSSLKAMSEPLSSYTLGEIKALPVKKRKTYRVVVSPKIKEKQVRPTVEKIVSRIAAKDNDIDEIALFLSSDKQTAKNGYADVATATWAPNGEWGSTTPEIASSNDRTNYKLVSEVRKGFEQFLKRKNQPERKFGLTTEQRKKVYIEISEAGKRAQTETDEVYPTDVAKPGWQENLKPENIRKRNELLEELRDKYKLGVRKKYGLSGKEMTQINNEGFEKAW